MDVVAHSLGGLIVRSYLAGKLDVAPAAYAPPANPGIRKAIFMATPHFGTSLASLPGGLGFDNQTQEMAPGSQFLFDLNTWNEGLDDLRGVDALAIAGSGGTGLESSTSPGFDDGVVTLTSASLGFIHTGRNPLGSTKGGINIQLQDSTGTPLASSSAAATTTTGVVNLAVSQSKQVVYSESLPATVNLPIQIQTGGATVNTTQTLPAGTVLPVILKPGPVIHGAVPAGGAVFPLDVAPGAYVAIYGTSLAGSTLVAPGPNFPLQLGDVQVKVNGAGIPIQYISSGQLNVIWPDVPAGLTKLTVVNGSGSFTTNVIVQPAVPTVFTLDGTAVAAINATSGAVVGPNAPLRAGLDYVELFLTGPGQTTPNNGLDYARIQPTVTIGGQDCNVSYAGRVPGVPALDQVNCPVPAGIAGPAVPVIVTSETKPRGSWSIASKARGPLVVHI